jgi:hypothetical protein
VPEQHHRAPNVYRRARIASSQRSRQYGKAIGLRSLCHDVLESYLARKISKVMNVVTVISSIPAQIEAASYPEKKGTYSVRIPIRVAF